MGKQNFGNICSSKTQPFISVHVKTLEYQLPSSWGVAQLTGLDLKKHTTSIYEPQKSPWSIDLDMYAVNKRDDIAVRVLEYTHVGGRCELGGDLHLSTAWNIGPQQTGMYPGRIWGRIQESAAFRIPQSTVGSIILKWKMLGTARNLSRAAWAISPSLQRRIGGGQ